MPLVNDGKISVVAGLVINLVFLIVKFVAYLYSHLNLFFADAIDSVADAFVISLILIFLQFNFENKLTFLNMDLMFFCQWSVILIFRIIIFLDQISDIIQPQPRGDGFLVIVVSVIVLIGSIAIIVLFIDEDDVIKCFISDEEKQNRKTYRLLQSESAITPNNNNDPNEIMRTSDGNKYISVQQNERGTATQLKKSKPVVLPILAEAFDNLATTTVALVIGILLYLDILVQYVYIIDVISNMAISLIMCWLACTGLNELIDKYRGKSQFSVICELNSTE